MLHKKRFGGITVAGVEKKEEKNRVTQIVLTLALFGTPLLGAFAIHTHGRHTALALALGSVGIVCFLALVGIAARAIRTWDY